MKNNNNPRQSRYHQREPEHKINGWIKAKEVRVVGENIEQGVYSLEQALAIAKEQELDLVEISPEAVPPVCRIVNYQKFLYNKKKKEKEIKSNQIKAILKQIRLGAEIGDHDFDFKMGHARAFLEEGNKVMFTIFFRGRAIMHKERGQAVMDKCAEVLADVAQVETPLRLEGKKMFLVLAPIKKKK